MQLLKRGFIFLTLLSSHAFSQTGQTITGVANVIDGDTISIDSTKIRLWGIDAFEPAQKCGDLDCGKMASLKLKEIIEFGKFRGFENVFCVEKSKDRYGRTVALCRIGGIDLSAEMVLSGYAFAFRKYSTDYTAEEEYAKSLKNGAWIGEFVFPENYRHPTSDTYDGLELSMATIIAPVILPAPQKPTNNYGFASVPSSDCLIKGNINSKGEKIYHLPNGINYNRTVAEKMFCSIREAEEDGFRAPRNSQPQKQVQPKPIPKVASRTLYFRTCAEARSSVRTPIFVGQPGYSRHLDRDGDGAACE